MSHTMKLSNYLFRWFMRGFGRFVFLATGVLGVILVFVAATAPSQPRGHMFQPRAFYSYDILVDGAGVSVVFFLGLLAVLVGIFIQANRYYVNGKAMYTMFTLPMKRAGVFFAFFFSAMAITLLYFAFWAVLMVICYFPVTAMQTKAAAEVVFQLSPDTMVTGIDVTRNNGLFLAFQRSVFLGACFPVSYLQAATLMGGMFLALVSVVFGGLYRQSISIRVVLLLLACVGFYVAFYKFVYNSSQQIVSWSGEFSQMPERLYLGIATVIGGAILLQGAIVLISRQKNI